MVMSNNRGKQIKERGQGPPSTGEYSHYAGMFAWDGRSHTVIGKQAVAMHSAPPSTIKKKKKKLNGGVPPSHRLLSDNVVVWTAIS